MSDWHNLTLGGPVGPKMPTREWNGLMLVGEVPGVHEVAHAEPMTGRVGRVFDKMIDAAGIDREATVITNVFRWLPVWRMDEEGKRRIHDTGIFFTDDPREGNARLPPFRQRYVRVGPDGDVRQLWRLVKRERPKLIVAMGATALWSLTGEDRIGASVGEYFDTQASDCKVLATWHPSYAMRKDDENAAVEIVKCLMKAAAFVAPKPVEPEVPPDEEF